MLCSAPHSTKNANEVLYLMIMVSWLDSAHVKLVLVSPCTFCRFKPSPTVHCAQLRASADEDLLPSLFRYVPSSCLSYGLTEGYWLKAVSYLVCRKCVANFRISPLVSSHGGYPYDPKISRVITVPHQAWQFVWKPEYIHNLGGIERAGYTPPCSTMLIPWYRLLSNCIRRKCARGLRVTTLWDHGLGMYDLREPLVRFWFMVCLRFWLVSCYISTGWIQAKDCLVIPEAFKFVYYHMFSAISIS